MKQRSKELHENVFKKLYRWIDHKIFLYNVTLGLYMLDWWERILFSILLGILIPHLLSFVCLYLDDLRYSCSSLDMVPRLQWCPVHMADICNITIAVGAVRISVPR